MDQARYDRLPKWAQNYIQRLTQERDRYHDELQQQREQNVTPLTVAWVGGYERRRPVADENQTIRFARDPDDYRSFIDVNFHPSGELQISGSGALSVAPRVSNVVHITTRRR